MPGRSRDSPSWTRLFTVQKLATKAGKGGVGKRRVQLMAVTYTDVYNASMSLSIINGAQVLQRTNNGFSREFGHRNICVVG